MKKINDKVDTQKRKTLIKNFKALAFMSFLFLPFSLSAKTGKSEKTGAVWG